MQLTAAQQTALREESHSSFQYLAVLGLQTTGNFAMDALLATVSGNPDRGATLVTYHTSYLSAMCGCAVKAGIGATSGIAYLLDGKAETVEAAIQNVAANITGMICDGAKEGCALKLTTSASVSVLSAMLAARGVRVPSDNGIVAERAEDTIRNIGSICKAMLLTDREVVRIMHGKRAG